MMNIFNLFNVNIGTPAPSSKVTTKDMSYTTKNHGKLKFPIHVVEKALENAIKNREFEIQMYWNRAKYFWLFVSALWVALGKLLYDWHFLDGSQQNNLYQFVTLFVLSCVGMGLSFAWYMVNKGSKFWQENWEHQINFLENEIIGPSYKTVLSNETIKKRAVFDQKWLGPFPYSVSKINVFISLSSTLLWLLSANIWITMLITKLFSDSIIQIDCCYCFIGNLLFNLIILALVYISSNKLKSTFKLEDREIRISIDGRDMEAHQRKI